MLGDVDLQTHIRVDEEEWCLDVRRVIHRGRGVGGRLYGGWIGLRYIQTFHRAATDRHTDHRTHFAPVAVYVA